MLLPKEIITSKNIVSETIGECQFQPCGVDLTLKEVRKLTSAGKIDFDNSEREISETEAIPFENGELHLPAGNYQIIYNEYVTIPADCAGLGYTRSSLLRCGAYMGCAVWDPGYHGRSESLLIVNSQHGITLHKNAKVMQLVFVRLEGAAHAGYSGQYKGENR